MNSNALSERKGRPAGYVWVATAAPQTEWVGRYVDGGNEGEEGR